MAAVSLTPDDLTPFAAIEATKAEVMIEDALALAARVAPCINDDTFAHEAAAKAILRAAILRWNDAGTGAMQQQTAGPYGITVDTRLTRKGMFWPSEIEQLQELCRTADDSSGAFAIDTVGTGGTAAGHADSCALNFGALYCSCGYVLTQELPLYGA